MARVSVGTTGWVGLGSRDYAKRFDVVEFNWTFHEREDSADVYKNSAKDLQNLRLQGILKVSGVATHEYRLRSPSVWWPGLWAKYAEFQKVGVLGGLLWQLAPSHACYGQTLRDFAELARYLPRDVLHVFEFRHSSWYANGAVLDILRMYGMCLAWIHIENEAGWCGDLPSGWPGKVQTCPTIYFRLFGTKSKAIGRYAEDFLREEVLPHVQGPAAAEEAYVVFAQADVPDHAKADATAVVEMLGRSEATISRATRWERDVLAATLGLAVGSIVGGAVQRISHKTIFIDIGRSCRAFMCVHHARRVGLLENLHVGTTLEDLVVENIDFTHEWGNVSLTCHNAVIDLPGGNLALPAPGPRTDDVESVASSAAPKKSRWGLRAAGSEEHAAATQDSTSTAGDSAIGSEPTIAQPGEPARLKRWLSGKRELPPAAKRREEDALARAEARKGIVLYIPIGRDGDEDTEQESETFHSDAAVSSTLVSEAGDRPTLNIDDVLLMQLEQREALETGADLHNSATFGTSWMSQGWTAEEMFSANERLALESDKVRTEDAQQTVVQAPEASSPTPTCWRMQRKRGLNKINPVHISNHTFLQSVKKAWIDLLEDDSDATQEAWKLDGSLSNMDVADFATMSRDDTATPELGTPSVTSYADGKGGSEHGGETENSNEGGYYTAGVEEITRNRNRRQRRRVREKSPIAADNVENASTATKEAESEIDTVVEEESDAWSQWSKQEESDAWSQWNKQVARWKDVQAARQKWEEEQQAAKAVDNAHVPVDSSYQGARNKVAEWSTSSSSKSWEHWQCSQEAEQASTIRQPKERAPKPIGANPQFYERAPTRRSKKQAANAWNMSNTPADSVDENTQYEVDSSSEMRSVHEGIKEEEIEDPIEETQKRLEELDSSSEVRSAQEGINEEDFEESVEEIQKRLSEVPTNGANPAAKILLGFQKQFRSMGQQGSSRTSSEASMRRGKWVRGSIRKSSDAVERLCSTERSDSHSIRADDDDQKSMTGVSEAASVDASHQVGPERPELQDSPSKAENLDGNAGAISGVQGQVEHIGANPSSCDLEHILPDVLPAECQQHSDPAQEQLDRFDRYAQAVDQQPEHCYIRSTRRPRGISSTTSAPAASSDPHSAPVDAASESATAKATERERDDSPVSHCASFGSRAASPVPKSMLAPEDAGPTAAADGKHEATHTEGSAGQDVTGIGTVNLVNEFDEDVEVAYVAVCDKCAAVHFVDVDIMAMGLEFTCSHVGAVCEGDTAETDKAEEKGASSGSALPVSSVPQLPPRSQISELTKEEKHDLFDRYVLQCQAEKLKPKDIQKGVAQLFAKPEQKERYRDSEIVTRKGEKFIKLNLSLDPGPGCQLGGILGWRSKAGRQGLGIRKMTKEEADRVCLSNKNRAHERKATGPGGYKQGITFENKWSQHTAETAKGTAPQGLKR